MVQSARSLAEGFAEKPQTLSQPACLIPKILSKRRSYETQTNDSAVSRRADGACSFERKENVCSGTTTKTADRQEGPENRANPRLHGHGRLRLDGRQGEDRQRRPGLSQG